MRSAGDSSRIVASEPFLFYQDPPDWRWLSFADAGKRMAEWAGRLRDLDLPPECDNPRSASVEALLCDLAARSAGLSSAQLPAADLEAAVSRLEQAVDSEGDLENRRHVVVHGRSLAELGERIIVEWAVRSAAAIVVAPSYEALAATAFWARPTILHGSADELEEWRHSFRAGEARARGLVSRFRRLGAVVIVGEGDLSEAAESFYVGLGARIANLELR